MPSYAECLNDCVSSLGVAHLVAGAVTGLGCYAVSVACPALIGGAAGAISGWCDAACDEPAPDGSR